MKRLAVLFGLVGVVGLVAVGCGSPKPSTVVEKFFAAVEKNNVEDMSKYATPETVALMAMLGPKIKASMEKTGKVKVLEETIDGDEATVTIDDGDGDTTDITLVKVDGKWKVDLSADSGK